MEKIRPKFPKRAVITAGMPNGNKELTFGHVGGYFVHADVLARFLRDRIGRENVIFVSGTDCYGSPVLEGYRRKVESGEFRGTIEEYSLRNHERQKRTYESYEMSNDLFGASAFGRASEIHREMSLHVMNSLYANGFLKKITTSQFYDADKNMFLNGRQVEGQCPIAGCKSEKGYADECSLGHSYMPSELINPKSTLSGKTPEMRDVVNWYLKLDEFRGKLIEWANYLEKLPGSREQVIKSIREFLEPPRIYIKREYLEQLNTLKNIMPEYRLVDDENKSSFQIVFDRLEDREKACSLLAENSIRYRAGKTLTPFRLTGNLEWGVPAPAFEGQNGMTIWVWPESLWAPISFTMTVLEKMGMGKDAWKDWWCSKEAKVYQFFGEDNIYFYGPAEAAIFFGMQGKAPSVNPPEGHIQIPILIDNNHILFLDKKASSSGSVKPPMADELLKYYTAEQLRAHFLGLGLGLRSAGFQPKPLNPKATEKDSDPVLKEGSLLTNAFNRAVRSCFYTAQKFFDGKIPVGDISAEIMEEAKKTILEFEEAIYKFEFHVLMKILDTYIRNINKYWSQNMKTADAGDDNDLRRKTLINTFHMVRTAAVLAHPVAPQGTEMIREYLMLGEEFWDWNRIFEPVYSFMKNPQEHKLKFLEPRVDFFKKHPSQVEKYKEE